MTASYQLLPRRTTMAAFAYAQTRFVVVWNRDGRCISDNAEAAGAAGCQIGDEEALERAARGIAQAPARP